MNGEQKYVSEKKMTAHLSKWIGSQLAYFPQVFFSYKEKRQ